jgi:hypothetical protein
MRVMILNVGGDISPYTSGIVANAMFFTFVPPFLIAFLVMLLDGL